MLFPISCARSAFPQASRPFPKNDNRLKKTPWYTLVATLAILVAIAALTYAATLTDQQVLALRPAWRTVIGWARPEARFWIFVFTAAAATIQAYEKLGNIFAFRHDRAKAVLDLMVKHLFANDPQQNRCTLFRARVGWRIYLHLFPRLLRQDDKWPILKDLLRIRPFDLYLYVYARASRARNAQSCAFFKVYRTKERDCEGFAGTVWVGGELLTLRNLDPPDPDALKSMTRGKTKLEDVGGSNNKLVRYARATNIKNVVQLRARERLARHFAGVAIEDKEGRKWGVLLVDSVSKSCPFPTESEGQGFAEDFETYARVLAAILT